MRLNASGASRFDPRVFSAAAVVEPLYRSGSGNLRGLSSICPPTASTSTLVTLFSLSSTLNSSLRSNRIVYYQTHLKKIPLELLLLTHPKTSSTSSLTIIIILASCNSPTCSLCSSRLCLCFLPCAVMCRLRAFLSLSISVVRPLQFPTHLSLSLSCPLQPIVFLYSSTVPKLKTLCYLLFPQLLVF